MAVLDVVAEASPPADAVIGVFSGDDVHERVNGYVIDVTCAVDEGFYFCAVWSDTDDSAAVHAEFFTICSCGVDESEVPDADVDPAVDTEADVVG